MVNTFQIIVFFFGRNYRARGWCSSSRWNTYEM